MGVSKTEAMKVPGKKMKDATAIAIIALLVFLPCHAISLFMSAIARLIRESR